MNNIFSDIFKGKIVIVGMGNAMKRDDGFGPALVKKFSGRKNVVCIDAGAAPENYVGKIAKEKPDNILIVDAVHLGLKPGEWRILRKQDIIKSGFTTHDLSPHLFIEYLENETKADIYMLGVEPRDVSFGEGMSDSVKESLENITGMIKEASDA